MKCDDLRAETVDLSSQWEGARARAATAEADLKLALVREAPKAAMLETALDFLREWDRLGAENIVSENEWDTLCFDNEGCGCTRCRAHRWLLALSTPSASASKHAANCPCNPANHCEPECGCTCYRPPDTREE